MNKKFIAFVSAGILLTLFGFQAANAQSWNLSGNSNVTGSSKLGTTTNTSVRFYTNNTQQMVLDSNGRLGIGTATPLNLLTLKLSGGTPTSQWTSGSSTLPAFLAFGEGQATGFNLNTAADAPGYRPVLNARRSRGTLAAPTAVKANDYLVSYVASGYDGTNFQNPAAIDVYVDGTPTAGNVPGRISFVTGTNSGNRVERLKIGNTGDITVNTSQFVVQQVTGNVGVGTATPAAKLDLVGTSTVTTPVLQIKNTFSGNADVRGISSVSKAADGWGYGIQATGGYMGGYLFSDAAAYTGTGYGLYTTATGSAGTRYGVFASAVGGLTNYAVYGSASAASGGDAWGGFFPTKTYTSELRVGGVKGASGYVASINGKLIATEVRVELLANWPDYVFGKEYKLMPIEDLANKIEAEKHLPGVPAAAQMKENGIMLGEMQTKTMEKVEENTLYIIQLNNKIKLLEEKIDELTKSKK